MSLPSPRGDKSVAAPTTSITASSPTSNGAPSTGAKADSQTGSGAAGLVLGAAVALAAAGANTKSKPASLIKSKAIDFGVGAVAGSLGAGDKTQRNIKDLVVSGGKSKSAQIGLGLGLLDKLTGKNLTGIYDLFANKDLVDILNAPTEPKIIPIGKALRTDSNIAKMRQRGDPLMGFDWGIGLPYDIMMAFVNTYGFTNDDLINFYVEDANIGLQTINSEATYRQGSQVYYPGFIDVGSLSLTFYEDNRMYASKFANFWHNQVRTADGLYNPPSKFKRDIDIYCYDATSEIAGHFRAVNCWPTARQPIALQSATSDTVKLTVDFATDGVYLMEDWSGQTGTSMDPSRGLKQSLQDNNGNGFFHLKTQNPLLNMMIEKAGINDKLNGVANKFASTKIGGLMTGGPR